MLETSSIFPENNPLVKFISFALLIGLLFVSCQNQESSNVVFDYYPQSERFEEGVVSKYYEHFYPNKTNSEPRTNIHYSLVRKTSESTYIKEHYNGAFEMTDYGELSVDDGKIFLDSAVTFFGSAARDTAISDIKQPVYEIWKEEHFGGRLEEHIDYIRDQYEIERIQSRILDSTVQDKPAKVLLGKRNIRSIKRDTIFRYEYASVYVQGLGLFSSLSSRQDGRFVTELVEQMSVETFKERQNHGKNRVAYIDPNSTMDAAGDFELCGDEQEIADYYNSDDDVRYIGDKGEMMKIIRSQLDRKKLNEESGYLTFRFVVNCKGEAGRFVTEQASLDYAAKQFPKEAIDHLYQITAGLEQWRPSVIRDEPRDAYVYITYKLQNGTLTDVLP